MSKTSRIVLLCQIVFFSSFCAVAALNICKKCGYENKARAPKCTHCKAALPVADDVEADKDVVDDEVEAKADYLPINIVSAEAAEGRKYYKKKKYELARLFFRNALAMEGLTDPKDGRKRSEHLLKLIRESEKAGRTITKVCPRCEGSGRGSIKFDSLGDGKGKSSFGKSQVARNVSGKKCGKCDGYGQVRVSGTIDDLKYQAGKAAAVFRKQQQTRKYEPLGNAWVPKDVVDGLGIRQRATLLRAVISPCRSCSGFGRIDCRKCKGIGRVECNFKGCVKGRIKREKGTSKGVKRMDGVMTKQCPECRGRGSQECESCSEEGTVLCSKCEGGGDSEICDKCDGRGYLDCEKCRGGAESRGVCKYCIGDGVVLCKSCNGEGHKK